VTRRRDRGQSLLEFALVMPVFLLLMVALIDFSRMLFTYVSLSNGTREFARVASVSTATNTSAVTAFNNLTQFAGVINAADSLSITVGNEACARAMDTGAACAAGTSTTVACPLPLVAATCALPARSQDGVVEVTATHRFQFNPLFQNRLANVNDVSFMRAISVLTTTTRVYVE
jgi:Flp pilus assembly protein TadG